MHRVRRGARRLSASLTTRGGRDHVTRATYSVLAFWGWFIYCFGPSIPLLRSDLGVSRAVAALHGTALAVGTVTSSVVSVPLSARLGRGNALVVAIGTTLVGMVLLIAGTGLAITLPGALVCGIGGSTCVNTVNPVLSEHQGARSSAFISEANAVAAGCGIVAPLALGGLVAVGLSWRWALGVSAPIGLVAMTLLLRAPRLPALVGRPGRRREVVVVPAMDPGVEVVTEEMAGPTRRTLGRPFWLALGVVMLLTGVEFCVTFWSADLLHRDTGLSRSLSSAALGLLLLGMTVGRQLVAPVTLRVPSSRLLLGAVALAGVGWLLMWGTGA